MPRKIPTPCREPGCPALTPEGGRCRAHRRTYERRRGTPGQRGYNAEWRRMRKVVLAAHPYCECGARATEVDHIKPLRQGGTHAPANLKAMCRPCHVRKDSALRRETGARR